MNKKSFKALEYNSIKNLLSQCVQSSLGKELVEDMYPKTDLCSVLDCLKETSQAVTAILKRGNSPALGIYDIRPIFKKAELGTVLGLGELLKIGATQKIARQLKQYWSEDRQNQHLDIIDSLINSISAIKSLENEIENSIISEEEISDNASETLRSIRRQIADVNNRIKDKLNQIIHSAKYKKFLQDNIITIRDGRYVVPVKQEYRTELPGLVHDSSSSGATLFIEPMSVVEANNKLKELKIKEEVEINVILSKLTQLVVENYDILESNTAILAKLDYIFAKGKFSLDLEAVEPKVNHYGYINLKKARHPLIDSKKVVPIDIELGKKFNTLVITGPNTGGKTVTLKTVGLFVLMVQSGLHIPVSEDSEISIFSKVYADIGDEQSIEQSLSTFSSHMTNIVEILKEVDNLSLCLFDELGAGTDPTEGSALAMAILNNLNKSNAKTIATTHYSELKAFALYNEGFENASCEFDIETLKPTYKVLMGVPGKSNAFEISKRLGLSLQIIDNAKQYISKEDIKFEDLIGSLHKEKETLELERQTAQKYRTEIEILKKNIQEQKQQFEQKKDKIICDARQKALEIIEEAKEESDQIISEIKKVSKIQQEHEREKLLNQVREKLKNKQSKAEDEFSKSVLLKNNTDKPLKNVKIGQNVYIVNINQHGSVLTLPDKDGNLQLQVGIMKISSNLKYLRAKEQDKEKDNQQKRIVSLKTYDISSEIDLRGQVLDDAIINVDKYLDDAYLSGLSQIMIIHGKGTGVLRSGIHQFLKSHPHVKTFRLGRYGEGEDGVTVVEIK